MGYASLLALPLILGSMQAPDTDEATLVEANNAFAIALYQRLAAEDPGANVFLSPYSVSAALAMTYEGARGATASEMAQALCFPAQNGEVWPNQLLQHAFGQVMRRFNADTGPYELNIANALWSQLPLRQGFVDTMRADYDAGLFQADFLSKPEAERQRINRWVEQQTHDRIKDLMPKGSIDEMTRLVLTNAIYFKGEWAKKFNKDGTRDMPFTLADGSLVDVPTMSVIDPPLRRSHDDVFVAVELPYVGEELAMLILMPKTDQTLAESEQRLSGKNLSGLVASLRDWSPNLLMMPKFKLEESYRLNQTLESMGMELAFEPRRADFSGLTEYTQDNLYVSDVVHKAFVEVNEEGTEAAAATGVAVRAASMSVFAVNRPFLFFIRDRTTGGILFMGRVTDPR